LISSPVSLGHSQTFQKEGDFINFSLLKENGGPSSPWLAAEFPQMNFSQIHERLRLEMTRRIQRGSLSISLLSRQTGFGQSHLSNFLHSRRQLSLDALDRILASQHMTIADLMPAAPHRNAPIRLEDFSTVPIVSHEMALFEPYVRPSAVQSIFHLPCNALKSLRSRAASSRRNWERFVAVRISATEAKPMEPLVLPGALVVIDRHYNSLQQYRPDVPNLYAVRKGAQLALRYVDFLASRLVLRPHNRNFPIDLIEVESESTPNDYLTGRVALILNET
jgi:hypothetical protein